MRLKWNTVSKDYTHGKTCPQSFYSMVFRGRHSWRNRNRRMLEEGSQFHFIATQTRFVVMLHSEGSPDRIRHVRNGGEQTVRTAVTTYNAMKGEIRTGAEGWLHCKYSMGHPLIITQPADQSVEFYFGIGWWHSERKNIVTHKGKVCCILKMR